LSGTTLTLLPVKICLQIGKGYSMLSYPMVSKAIAMLAILANFLTSDL